MKLDFDKSDDLWLAAALDDDKRNKTLQLKQRLRRTQMRLTIFVLVVGVLGIFANVIDNVVNHKSDMGGVAFMLVIVYSLFAAYEKTENEIKLLKLAGALKATQQKQVDETNQS